MKSEMVYLAGKIGPNDWRTGILPDLRDWCGNILSQVGDRWPHHQFVSNGASHTYVGPYFVGCDHACAHQSIKHAYSRDFVCGDPGSPKQERDVVRLCRLAIADATVVFGWLDAPDAYGTLWELGYAAGLGKRVVVATGDHTNREQWFAHVAADARIFGASSAEYAFRRAVGDAADESPEPILVPRLPKSPCCHRKLSRKVVGNHLVRWICPCGETFRASDLG